MRRKRHYIMTGRKNGTGRHRPRAIGDYARRDYAERKAARFGPLVWIETR